MLAVIILLPEPFMVQTWRKNRSQAGARQSLGPLDLQDMTSEDPELFGLGDSAKEYVFHKQRIRIKAVVVWLVHVCHFSFYSIRVQFLLCSKHEFNFQSMLNTRSSF